ncbi:hypothetical protein [Stenotrophobium rhamnosiphilum]|uniref:hypothetical protein n=1 Tax=Stenotrophobium rhamnosiphilum TaxID=2029166 RepID=UPI00137502C0|nr:hypothetical protein [Stenotrophobium rhamnosiphilum]
MTSQTYQNQPTPLTADRPAAPASRKPSMLEHGQFAVVVLSIFVGLYYIARALLAG